MFSEICPPFKYFSEVLGYEKSSFSSVKIVRSLFLLMYNVLFQSYKMKNSSYKVKLFLF